MSLNVLRLCLLAALPVFALPVYAQSRGLDVRDMVALERVSAPALAPDGSQVLMLLRKTTAEGTPETGVYLRHLLTRDLAAPRRLTPEGWNASAPAFSPDGRQVYFLSDHDGTQQLYVLDADAAGGSEPQPLTAFALDIDTWHLSPDGRSIAFSAATFAGCGADFACTREQLDARKATKASGVLYERLFVRHWDTWADGRHNHLFVAELPSAGAAAVTQARALSTALDGDVPSKPFGGADEYTWAPDGQALVASVRIAGSTEPWSTNFDLWRLPLDGGAAINLTADNPAWDTGPVFSRDGSTLYYRAMRRAGFEADRFAIMALDLASGQRREIAPAWDRSADSLLLAPDGRTLYVTAQDVGQKPLFRVDIASGEVTPVFSEGTVSSVDAVASTVALTRNTMQTHDQLLVFTLDTDTNGAGPVRTLTPSASEQRPDVQMGEFEQFHFTGWNNETVYGYVLKPWNYEEGKKYPVAFLIHGGPQGSFGNGWSYRWNPQTYAGQGYAVVMVDFHGSTGYGQAFTDSITGHWGDRPLEDLQKGWQAALQRYDFLDGEHACALGASYGGYMVNWIASQWNGPWSCLVNHNGVFDTRSMGLVTEELWFAEWEFGGTVAQHPEGYERFNPARHIGEWRVPTLVVAGQNDFRVPLDQSLSSFTALQRQGIESRLLYFPDENHWVNKPDNSILWHDTVNAWLRQHLGQPAQ